MYKYFYTYAYLCIKNIDTYIFMQTFQLPLDSSDQFPSLFDYMDNHEVELGVGSYGMSVTTLEEVFIKVAHATKTIEQQDQGAREGRRSSKNMKNSVHISEKNSGMYESKVINQLYKYVYTYIYVCIYVYMYTHISMLCANLNVCTSPIQRRWTMWKQWGMEPSSWKRRKKRPLLLSKRYIHINIILIKKKHAYINFDINIYHISCVEIATAPRCFFYH
jgi:hypothetical protein